MKKLFAALILTFFVMTGVSYAGDITFGWDAYTDTATGFKLYCSTTNPVTVAPANLQATITPITLTTYKKIGMAAGTYYCGLTAYSLTSESVLSNQITVVVPLAPPANLKLSSLMTLFFRG